MKIEYTHIARKRAPITAKEKQVVYDYITDSVGYAQAVEALGFKSQGGNNFYAKVAMATRTMYQDGDIKFTKKEF